MGQMLDHKATSLLQTFKYEQITGEYLAFCNRKMCHDDKITFIPFHHNNGNKSGYCFDKKLSHIHFSSCFTLIRFTVHSICHPARSFEQASPLTVFNPGEHIKLTCCWWWLWCCRYSAIHMGANTLQRTNTRHLTTRQ